MVGILNWKIESQIGLYTILKNDLKLLQIKNRNLNLFV